MWSEISAFNPWVVAVVLNSVLWSIASIVPKKLLTPSGYVHAWILGVLIWGCLGWRGYSIVMVYFLVGSAVTRIGMAEKEAAGIAEKRQGARGPENVWGSALTATLCAIGFVLFAWTLGVSPVSPSSSLPLPLYLLLLGYVASFATKLSDTAASEVGKAYGKRTFLITTLQPVPRGTEGAVSLEGTLAGVAASILMALLGWGIGSIDALGAVWCVVAAFVATNAESLIGATLQDKFDWMTNEVVNFINTSIGAVVAMSIAFVWLSFQPF
ncbi:MAG: TIGR00297 family protein [Cyanobacteria bacterium SID2]|nr:TIGR00297 family protein [Cyanobacteria bacterium SID2]MBP0002542.1 TIGR00297 family protein [Cyanobacteria bacterium SBC]